MIFLLGSCLWVSEKCSEKLHNHADGAITRANIPYSAGPLIMLSNSFLNLWQSPFSCLVWINCKLLLLFSIPSLIFVPYLSIRCFHLYSKHQDHQVSISSVFLMFISEIKYIFFTFFSFLRGSIKVGKRMAMESDSISALQSTRCVTLGRLLTLCLSLLLYIMSVITVHTTQA